MDSGFIAFILVAGVTLGGLFGYQVGSSEKQEAVMECEKELPRNVHCKIIAVPVDRN